MGNQLQAALENPRHPFISRLKVAEMPVLVDTPVGLASTGSILRKHSAVVENLSPSTVATQRALLQWQRTYGNRYVQRVVGLGSRVSSAAYERPSLQRQDDPSQVAAMGSLSVHVQNGKNNAPIVGANVHIDQAGVSGPKTIDLKTDRNGDTTTVYLDAGDYDITVTFWCCDPITFTAHVDAGATNFQYVGLKNCDCRVSSEDDHNNGNSVDMA